MVIVLNICAIIESICKQSQCVRVTYMLLHVFVCEMCVRVVTQPFDLECGSAPPLKFEARPIYLITDGS